MSIVAIGVVWGVKEYRLLSVIPNNLGLFIVASSTSSIFTYNSIRYLFVQMMNVLAEGFAGFRRNCREMKKVRLEFRTNIEQSSAYEIKEIPFGWEGMRFKI